MNGSLSSLAAGDTLPLETVRKYTLQISLGLEALHVRKLVHRDLKGDNVFLDAHMNCKGEWNPSNLPTFVIL